MSPLEKYVSELELEYGIEEGPVWTTLRWAASRCETPQEAAKVLRDSLGRRTRRRPWEEDVYLDALTGSSALLEALAWLQGQA